MALVLNLLLLVSYWVGSEACNGYKLHVREFKNCDDNSILKLHNFNVTLTDDCFILPSGCIESTKEIHSATMSYKYVKNMTPITGSKDVCQSLSGASEQATTALKLLALPTSCPIKQGKVCNDDNKKVEMTKSKMKLPLLLGDLEATLKIDSDAGQSCIHFKGALSKKLIPKLPVFG